MSKYGARKVVFDGITFDSGMEAQRYWELKLLQRANQISDLRLQVKFDLLPAQKWKGKTVEKSVAYYADFTYIDKNTGEFVVEDVKGKKTTDYILKRKMMLYFHGIRIREM